MLWRKTNAAALSAKKKSTSEARRAVDWERVEGATLPLPRLKLGSLRSPRFLAACFPHCGAWSQAKRPRTQTEYRKSKGVKIGKTEKCERIVLWKAWKTTALLFSVRFWFGLLNTSFSPVPAFNVFISLWCSLLIKFAFLFFSPLLFHFSRRLGRNCCLDSVSSTPWFKKEESLVP